MVTLDKAINLLKFAASGVIALVVGVTLVATGERQDNEITVLLRLVVSIFCGICTSDAIAKAFRNVDPNAEMLGYWGVFLIRLAGGMITVLLVTLVWMWVARLIDNRT